MENEEAKTIANNSIAQPFADSSPTQSNSPPRDAKSSSPSSLSSDLSHESFPREEKPPVPVMKRYVRDVPVVVTKVDSEGGGRWRVRQSLSFLRRVKRESMVKKAALGFRVFGVVFCLISFSLMAADRYKGWAFDSFDRYKEFRYCLSVNVIGFVYNLAQALDLAHHLLTGKYFSQHPLRYYFDFAMDQLLRKICKTTSEIPYSHQRATPLPTKVTVPPNRNACTFSLRCPAPLTGMRRKRKRLVSAALRLLLYSSSLSPSSELLYGHLAPVAPLVSGQTYLILTYLLMSASSSAATRVEDWESNWGNDKFTEMASASVGLSFIAFVALAASSLISGYALCTFRST
ncbi:uncharacterized protein family [Actinidia rufa]|uniref:CASP-like protein n=1 Tax=Actinidia rufa TaxID=165716 RepID=A0A7J0EL41_9ERIC|nr:uncharacterized protein family [Actinidia rufa]